MLEFANHLNTCRKSQNERSMLRYRDSRLIDVIAKHTKYCRRLEKLDAELELTNNVRTSVAHRMTALDYEIASIRAEGLRGLFEKARWLLQPENFNEGEFDGGNAAVLESLLEDVVRLCAPSLKT